jgi:hypothetical protein
MVEVAGCGKHTSLLKEKTFYSAALFQAYKIPF